MSQSKMLRTGNWKYIYTLVGGHHLEEELYNLDKDPDELFNLAHDDEQKDRVVKFRTEILRWLTATEPSRLHPAPENHYRFAAIEKNSFSKKLFGACLVAPVKSEFNSSVQLSRQTIKI